MAIYLRSDVYVMAKKAVYRRIKEYKQNPPTNWVGNLFGICWCYEGSGLNQRFYTEDRFWLGDKIGKHHPHTWVNGVGAMHDIFVVMIENIEKPIDEIMADNYIFEDKSMVGFLAYNDVRHTYYGFN